MDEMIVFISRKLGITESMAREAVKVLLQFAQKQVAGTELETLLAKIPGAAALAAEAPAAGENTNPLGGLIGGMGSLLGGQAGHAAKALAALQAAGLPTSQIGPFVQAFVEKGREVAGPETVDAVLKKIPALEAFLKPRT